MAMTFTAVTTATPQAEDEVIEAALADTDVSQHGAGQPVVIRLLLGVTGLGRGPEGRLSWLHASIGRVEIFFNLLLIVVNVYSAVVDHRFKMYTGKMSDPIIHMMFAQLRSVWAHGPTHMHTPPLQPPSPL